VIISLPKVAVNVAPANVPVAPAPTSGKFSTALADATGNTGNTARPNRSEKSDGNNKRSIPENKDAPKGKAKASGAPAVASPVEQPLASSFSKPAVSSFANRVLALPVLGTPELPVSEPAEGGSDSEATSGIETTLMATKNCGEAMPASFAQNAAVAATQVAVADTTLPAATPKQSGVPNESIQKSVMPELATGNLAALEQANSGALKLVAHEPNTAAESPDKSNISAAVPVLTTPAAEPKADVRKAVSAASLNDLKPTTGLITARLHSAAAPAVVVPPAPIQSGNINPASTQVSRPTQSVVGNSDSGIVPSSTKKDGDAARKTPPSDKAASLSAGEPRNKAIGDAVASVARVGTGPLMSESTNSDVTAVSQAAMPTAETKTIVSDGGAKANALPPNAAAHNLATTTDHAALPETPSVSPLQVARLVEHAGQSELRVGIQAGELGTVSIRTSMSHSQLSAEISVDRGELGRALTAELPNLHDRLAEQRVLVSNIVLHDYSSQNGSGGFQQGSRHNTYGQSINKMNPDEAESLTPIIASEMIEGGTGLDIHM